MKPINEAKVEFLSRSANEGFARAAAACFAAQMDPTLEELGDIKTVVSEGVTNAIVHAYPDKLGKVMLRMRIYPNNLLEIVIRDWGVGILDVERAREPMYTTGGAERSGMGFTIMESFMDSLKVRSQTGKGTTLTLRRKISHRLPKNGERSPNRRICWRRPRMAIGKPVRRSSTPTTGSSGASSSGIPDGEWSWKICSSWAASAF